MAEKHQVVYQDTEVSSYHFEELTQTTSNEIFFSYSSQLRSGAPPLKTLIYMYPGYVSRCTIYDKFAYKTVFSNTEGK